MIKTLLQENKMLKKHIKSLEETLSNKIEIPCLEDIPVELIFPIEDIELIEDVKLINDDVFDEVFENNAVIDDVIDVFDDVIGEMFEGVFDKYIDLPFDIVTTNDIKQLVHKYKCVICNYKNNCLKCRIESNRIK